MVSEKCLREAILRDYRRCRSWHLVAQKYQISKGLAYRMAHGYVPKTPGLRFHLGLPALVPAPVCTKCGSVHITHRCIKRSTRWSDTPIQERPSWLLRWYLDHREEITS